jgi:hypothetical protein
MSTDMRTWDELTTTLTAVLTRLPERAVLELLDTDLLPRGWRIQLWPHQDQLHADLREDAALRADHQFTQARWRRLTEFGWSPDGTGDVGVWSITTEPAEALAGRVAELVREVLHQNTPAGLAYRSWAPDGAALTWPSLGLGQLDIGYYARVSPGAAVQRPTGLLRRMSYGRRLIDEVLSRAGTWVAVDVLGQPGSPQRDGDLYRVDDEHAADAMIASWANGSRPAILAGGTQPRRAGSAVEAMGERPTLDRFERRAVAGYLSQAPMVCLALGADEDPFGPGFVPLSEHSDGSWIWSESAAYFARTYGIPPHAGLLADIRRHNYRWPTLDQARIEQIGQLVRGDTAGQELSAPDSGGDWLIDPQGQPDKVIPVTPPDRMDGFRFAAVFDGMGDDGGPIILAERSASIPQEAYPRALRYLETGRPVHESNARGTDRFDPTRRLAVPGGYRTDGLWVWPEAIAYYLRHHQIPPEAEFGRWIAAQGYRCPPVSEETVTHARAVLVARAEVIEDMAAPYLTHEAALELDSRFPPDVTEVLVSFDWTPGRDVADTVSVWFDQLLARQPWLAEDRPEALAAGRRILDEFGGLSFPLFGAGQEVGVVPFAFHPGRRLPDTYRLRHLGRQLGTPVFPVGDVADGRFSLVVDRANRVYLTGDIDRYLGATIDEAVIRLVRGLMGLPVDNMDTDQGSR